MWTVLLALLLVSVGAMPVDKKEDSSTLATASTPALHRPKFEAKELSYREDHGRWLTAFPQPNGKLFPYNTPYLTHQNQ